MQYIIVRGNPIDGFDYVGPFDSCDEAVAYMSEDDSADNQWVTHLAIPHWIEKD